MLVSALVEATAISGPACKNTPLPHSRAIALPTTLTAPSDLAALPLQLLDGHQRVQRLAGLADRDVERVGVDHRVPVAEFGGGLGVRGHPGQLLDQDCSRSARRSRPIRSRGT